MKTMWLTGLALGAGLALAGAASAQDITVGAAGPMSGGEATFGPLTVDDNLREWEYGEYEGLTTQQIRMTRPGWSIFRNGASDGESPELPTFSVTYPTGAHKRNTGHASNTKVATAV